MTPRDTHAPLRLSDRARAKLQSLAAEHGAANTAVRVFAEESGDGTVEMGLAFDRKRLEDREIEDAGVTVIADEKTLSMTRNRVIDYEPAGFTFAHTVAIPGQLPNS